MEGQHPTANNREGEGEDRHQYFDGRRIHRVPDLVRFNKHNEEDYYAPKMVSFGPYYHGLPKLGMAEEFKHEVLKMFVSRSGKSKQFFYCQIFKLIDQIRNCYVGVSRDAYDDGTLAEMILLDASFAIYLMKISMGGLKEYYHFCQHLGRALKPFAMQDLCLLENQIPLWVIELLTNLIYGNDEGRMLIWNFSNYTLFPDRGPKSITGNDKKQPLHLVDAFHQLLLEEPDKDKAFHQLLVEEPDNAGEKPSSYCLKNINFKSKCRWWPWKKKNPYEFGKYYPLYRQSHSVTDLKAKGIHFKPSSSCLKNIKFESYKLYGQLQLPICLFTNHSKHIFLQMIAYETSPESDVGTSVICCVNFLKSLIVNCEDVKELREKNIFFRTLDSDEQVVEVIKGINTCGLHGDYIFGDVKREIEEHCRSKARTWIDELINTHCRSPWTFIALVAATLLLCLTFLQTYYTMNPK